MASKRIGRELQNVHQQKLEHIIPGPISEDNLHDWSFQIEGPPSTVYKSGLFDVECKFPTEYPFKPPEITFKTKIFHPNIDSDGKICLGLLKADEWKPSTKMTQVFDALVQLLITPNPDDALSTHIAEMYRSDRKAFDKTAKEWLKRYCK